MLFIALSGAYLCPGDGIEAHITDNAQRCACGETNLVSLASILDQDQRVMAKLEEGIYVGLMSDLPAIRKLWS